MLRLSKKIFEKIHAHNQSYTIVNREGIVHTLQIHPPTHLFKYTFKYTYPLILSPTNQLYVLHLFLNSNFVPISLLVTLEMVKFFQGVMVGKDPKMKDDVIHSNTTVQTSRLMEEIGQVEYIFSDKTGTLTCNIMEFKNISILGESYGENYGYDEMQSRPKVTNVDFRDLNFFDGMNKAAHKDHNLIHENLYLLSTCHTINIETKNGAQTYSASSPDELALVNFAKFAGYEYVGTSSEGYLDVSVNGSIKRCKLLHILEFNSDRKRMSVVIELDGEIILYCKGADSIIIDRMNQSSNAPYIDQIKENLKNYADKGLRTLLLAKRRIPRDVFEKWNERYMEASCAIKDRESLMSQQQEDIERELEIIGATAIEDKLQDQVGNTIASLKEAGIKVWVLTGDKNETAINIGFSCKLLDKQQIIFTVDVKTTEELLQRLDDVASEVNTKGLGQPGKAYAMVITGGSLLNATTTAHEDKLYNVFKKAEVVIGCRVSPKQKKEVVELVKNRVKNTVTLAIGDGANDVNMITAAHVGVGIRGLEGYQVSCFCLAG